MRAAKAVLPNRVLQSDKKSRGYSPLYEQQLDQSNNQSSGDTKESIYLWGEPPNADGGAGPGWAGVRAQDRWGAASGAGEGDHSDVGLRSADGAGWPLV